MARFMCMVGVMIVVAATLMVNFAAAQTVHVVGDSLGWTVPPNGAAAYTSWASNKQFMVGDILVFNFATNEHDVVELSKESFDACNYSNPIGSIITTGPANITLNATGNHYYICTIGRHCAAGQKLAITVSATPSSNPPSASPASPPPTTIATPSPTATPDDCAPTPSPSLMTDAPPAATPTQTPATPPPTATKPPTGTPSPTATPDDCAPTPSPSLMTDAPPVATPTQTPTAPPPTATKPPPGTPSPTGNPDDCAPTPSPNPMTGSPAPATPSLDDSSSSAVFASALAFLVSVAMSFFL
ncbi:hypothetical protein PVL29_011663 [Vitis rotundifolia]|uniref:Phytocyanin domain-containing protein n=1 Tax=Vitis rotundifolia TaxID=103349 RepID=A0AA38ZP40_VITRO|nr:hypothetical protein PVL29_011663 [Vitis rotundifolia]